MQATSEWPTHPRGYRLDSPIGFGAFGTVYSARVTEGPHLREKIAVKTVDLEQFPDSNLQDMMREIQVMRLNMHPNIVSYHVCFLSGNQLWLIMPIYAGGSIADIMRLRFPRGLRDEALIATILKETLQGLAYIHENFEIHRDLKGANILLAEDGRVCIGDFGVTARLKEGKVAKTLVGSPCWMAPEVVDPEVTRGYNFKADIWSFGITAMELAHGVPPYYDNAPMKVIMLVLKSQPPEMDSSEAWDPSFREIINSCLKRDPKERPTADQLLRKRFFSKARDANYIREQLLTSLPPLENRTKVPESFYSSKPQVAVQSSGSWDFSASGEQAHLMPNRKPKGDDPLESLAEDEDDPLSRLGDSE